MRQGAAESGLSDKDLRPIFFDNGMRLIHDVKKRMGYK